MARKSYMTFKDLVDSTGDFKYWRKNYPNAEFISEIKIIPYKGIKSIVFAIQCRSKTAQQQNAIKRSKNKKLEPVPIYTEYIQFMEVEFGDRIENNDWTYVEYKGTTYFFKKPSLFINPVRVRCNCPDFRFRFSWEDRDHKALYGGPPRNYTRKTPKPPVGRPYANEKHIPGICYHIYDFAKQLEPYVTLVR